MVPTFFDSHSPDMATTIFRFLSDRTYASNWESYEHAEDFYPVCCGDNVLSELYRAQFTKLRIFKLSRAAGNALDISLGSSKDRGVTAKAKKMLQVGARHTTKLIARRCIFPGMGNLCIRLKELELYFDADGIATMLKGLQSQLHSLYLSFQPSKQDFAAIAMYCTRLR